MTPKKITKKATTRKPDSKSPDSKNPDSDGQPERRKVTRVQTGLRIEKRILKVLKGMAEYHDMTLGDLVEGIVLHAFEGKAPFEPASLEVIARLREVYDLDLQASDSHLLQEGNG